ncbi:hypothetical protein ACK3TF_002865 [Chlorella vulgaris]
MSSGRTGLIKAIKEVLREVKVFGDAELATLRRDIQQHKAQLEQLKATRLEQQQREEALALHEMRKAVELLQKMDGALADADERLEAQAESLARKSIARQEREMTNRAVSVMQGLNVSDVLLAEEDSLAEHLDRARKQLAAELEAAGRGQPSPAAAGSTGSGSSSGGSKPGRRQQ